MSAYVILQKYPKLGKYDKRESTWKQQLYQQANKYKILCGLNAAGLAFNLCKLKQFLYNLDSLALRFPALNMLDILQPCDVRDYVQHDLTPVLSGSTECNKEVNILVDFLIEQLPLDVSQGSCRTLVLSGSN